MASIPGAQLSLTGASGTQAALTPKNGWFAYVFPRGAWASQDSSGTQITFDSSSIAGRFAANNWIQVGLNTANIRKVSAVGGNSITVQGSAVTVTEQDRVFIIGNTQPSVSGGSATYIVPATTIRARDDDTSDRFTNSIVTSNADGLVQFYASLGLYDVMLQDGNQSNQGYIADLPVGVAEGISTTFASVFGATVLINAVVGITGNLTVTGNIFTGGSQATIAALGSISTQSNMTVAGLLDQQGLAQFGVTSTFNANAGITGSLVVGRSLSVGGSFSVTGGVSALAALSVGTSLTVAGRITGTSSVLSNDLTVRRIFGNTGTLAGTTYFTLGVSWGTQSNITIANPTNDTRGQIIVTGGTSPGVNPSLFYVYTNGPYTSPPTFVTSRHTQGLLGPNGLTATVSWLASTTGVTFTFHYTAVKDENYGIAWISVG